MKTYTFSALIDRMKYIKRWGLMYNTRIETLAEHSAQTAQLSCILASAANQMFGAEVSPEKVAAAAVYHDAAEVLTGDLPTPIKYKNAELRNAYKALEESAEKSLLELLPAELLADMEPIITHSNLNEREKLIVKAADRLSSLIKCIEETQTGNHEFKRALKSQYPPLEDMHLPEVNWFMQTMLPAYFSSLDELVDGKF